MSTISFNAQEITLKISSKDSIENSILKEIKFLKNHKDSISAINEIYKISTYLKKHGYLTNSIGNITSKNDSLKVYIKLNKRVNFIFIRINKESKQLFKNFIQKKDFYKIPIEILQTTLDKISDDLDMSGKPFSKIQLKNIIIKNDNLFADIQITQSEKRVIDRVIIKNYEEFPKSFLKNYFLLNKKTTFNKKKIREISDLSKNINFIKEIKPPEILFTRDSTIMYLYLKKQQNNSFDGIMNFSSEENGKLLFNGNLDLKLNNILNNGESFNLFWNSIGKERQEINISTKIPYIFNSKLSPEISFSIYKQDSSFLSSKFNSKLFYNLNTKSKIALTFNSESSENLHKGINNNIKTFNNFFIGIEFDFRVAKRNIFNFKKFNLNINPTLGKRKTEKNSSNQFKIKTSVSYILDLNTRNSFFFRNETGILNSNTPLKNELFRVGGANSLRGPIEQSIFSDKYTYFNIEYRYLTSKKSYIYSITDYGKIKTNSKYVNISSFGLGYNFIFNNTQINLRSIFIKDSNQKINLKKPQTILSLKTLF